MSERKVLNKYYPPDFDPSKIPRRRQPKNHQMKVRTMIPMKIRCNTCGNYIDKGKKLNSRMEDVAGETYLGIHIFRFYSNCTNCSAEIIYKTDPKNSDYTVEAGAVRSFEPWLAADEEIENESGDAMKSMENRRLNSKQEMDIFAALDELKSMKSRQEKLNIDDMLEELQQLARDEKEERLNQVEEAFVKALFEGRRAVNKIDDDDDEEEDDMSPLLKRRKVDGGQLCKKKISETETSLPKIVVHKKKQQPRSHSSADSKQPQEEEDKPQKSIALQSLFQQYGSDDIG